MRKKLKLPEGKRLSRSEYDKILRQLQIELVKLQNWATDKGKRIVVIFEGRDAAGKGGTILRILQYMNPRGAFHVALAKPTDKERSQFYFQRYIQHLPSAGEIVIFDRSWYNRSGVEIVMGFCTKEEYEQFLRAVPVLEAMLIRSGIHLIKYWLEVGRRVQKQRFKDRQTDPLRQWKLSPIDLQASKKWAAYSKAKREMFLKSSTPEAPWTVIRSDSKKMARINCIRHLLSQFSYAQKDKKVAVPPDPRVVGSAADPQFCE